MTARGIRIVAGSKEDGGEELVPLADTKGLSRAEYQQLAAIDAHRSEAGWNSETSDEDRLRTGRSAVADTATSWKWIRDPKGRDLRYVGP